MRTVTLRDGRKVQVTDAAYRKALATVDAKRPKPAAGLTKNEVQAAVSQAMARVHRPRVEVLPPQQQDAGMSALAGEVRRLADQQERIAGALQKLTGVMDPTPALRQLERTVKDGADRIISTLREPVSVVRDANGKPVGSKRG